MNIWLSFTHPLDFQLLVWLMFMEITFFCYNKSSEYKVKFRQGGSCLKSVPEAAKLVCANKTKQSIVC